MPWTTSARTRGEVRLPRSTTAGSHNGRMEGSGVCLLPRNDRMREQGPDTKGMRQPRAGSTFSDTVDSFLPTERRLFSTSAAALRISRGPEVVGIFKHRRCRPQPQPGRCRPCAWCDRGHTCYLRQRRGHYALITAFSVLEHQTRPELFEMLDAIRAALTPGGNLIAVVPNAKGLFGAHVRFADITHELSFPPNSEPALGRHRAGTHRDRRARAARAWRHQRSTLDRVADHSLGAARRPPGGRRRLAMAGVHPGSRIRRA